MPQENKFNLSIIIPIFNEENYINRLFLDLKKYFNEKNVEVIVINDGSNDNSNKILEELKNDIQEFNYNLINLSKNYGKGYAVRQGVKKSKGNFILLQDADLELDLKDSREIYETISKDVNIDCIFGSRYLSGKIKKHNNFINELFGKPLNVSEEAIADEFSSAASILQGQAAEGRPIVLIRGYSTSLTATKASYLIRKKEKDLFQ